jgi:hypothetical protein
MNEEEDWDHEYPEGSFGWNINNKIDAIGAKPLKSGAVFMFLFTVFFVPTVVEIVFHPNSTFFMWRIGKDAYNLAQWNMVVYIVTLLMFAGAFLYFGARLLWDGGKTRNAQTP